MMSQTHFRKRSGVQRFAGCLPSPVLARFAHSTWFAIFSGNVYGFLVSCHSYMQSHAPAYITFHLRLVCAAALISDSYASLCN